MEQVRDRMERVWEMKKRKNCYGDITTAVRVLAMDYQYDVFQNKWYYTTRTSTVVSAGRVRTAAMALAMDHYATDKCTPDVEKWASEVLDAAVAAPEVTVRRWLVHALDPSKSGDLRGCYLHAVWAKEHGIYDRPTPYNNFSSHAAYASNHRSQAKRFYDTLEREGQKYGIRKSFDGGVMFVGCALMPQHNLGIL